MSTKKERAYFVKGILDTLFPDPPIPLAHHNPYTLLIAVLLSAQSTDARVNQVTPHLFACAATPEAMAQQSISTIANLIYPCGLSQKKAKAIVALSKTLVKTYKGNVPCSFAALEKLPGVGHKTASVVMAQAFQVPAFPVDTHIHRCAKRWRLSTGRTVIHTEKDLKALFPRSCWNRLHLQIIYYARKYCPARGHHIHSCPICSGLETDLKDP